MSAPVLPDSPLSKGRTPGDWLLHPVPLLAMALLALNDRILKEMYGNWLTGKLSDVAGLVFFPLFLLCLVELFLAMQKRSLKGTNRAGLFCVLVTGLLFACINLSETAGHWYAVLITAGWDAASLVGPAGSCGPEVAHTVDATDLMALPALVVPLSMIRHRNRRNSEQDTDFPRKSG